MKMNHRVIFNSMLFLTKLWKIIEIRQKKNEYTGGWVLGTSQFHKVN